LNPPGCKASTLGVILALEDEVARVQVKGLWKRR
jgi:hypothetical protein